MSVIAQSQRAFVVRFRDLGRWDPASFHRIRWCWSPSVMRAIGSVLTLRKTKIDRANVAFADLRPVTIHFDGSIDERSVEGGRAYTMDLFAAEPGDIIVAKIDLKNGAVAIVPDDWTNVAVTGHFAVYEPDRSRLVPQYLHLLIQTGFFKSHLWSNKVGAEGRKEVKLDFFETDLIPLPPLAVQRKIVAVWEAAQKAALETALRIKQIEHEIETCFLADLGLKASEKADRPKAFVVPFAKLERWGVDYNQQQTLLLDPGAGKYAAVRLGEAIADLENGWSPKCLGRPAHDDEWGVLKMGAVSFGVFDESQNKALPSALAGHPALEVHPGDFLISRANITRLVGACALVRRSRPRLMLCDKIFRAVWRDPSLVDPAYLDEILKTPHLRQQIEGAATGTSATMKNITKPALLALRLPLPPLPVQRGIIQRVDARRIEVARLRKGAQKSAKVAKADIDAMILGTKPVH